MKSKILLFTEKALIIFITSITLFSIIDVSYKLYAIITICICGLFRVKFKNNLDALYSSLGIMIIASICGFLGAQYINKNNIYHFDSIDTMLLVMMCTISIAFLATALFTEKTKIIEKKRLMEQQIYDVDRLIDYIECFDIIGVNGAWGSGKSFLIDYIKECSDISQKYIFVKIDLLSCNLEQIHLVIFDLLCRVLNDERVYSKSSKQIKRFLSNISIIDNIYNSLKTEEISYYDALQGLKEELYNLDKVIVVVYEDIDRITESGTIKRIFSIAEQLACEKVKIIYQYDSDNLEKLGFDREYVEKYIPYIVNLTPISFSTVIKHLYDEGDIDNKLVELNDFDFISLPQIITIGKCDARLSLKNYKCSIRKVKHFLIELIDVLEDNEEYRKDNYKKIVIIFFVLKHFYFNIYKEIKVAESLMDTIIFEYNKEQYSAIKLMDYFEENNLENREQIHKLVNNSSNCEKLFFLHNLGYSIDKYHEPEEYGIRRVYGENIRISKQLNSNNKIDRLIWNLMYNGKSEYTNLENAVKKFVSEVLNECPEKQEVAYRKFLDDMYNNDLYKGDNTTIFKIGVSPIFSVFRAFYVSNVDKESWIKLIDFYFDKKISKISHMLIAALKYCNISFNSVYICILKRFNELPIEGNFNDTKYYMDFLVKYLEALSLLAYTDTYELHEIKQLSNVYDGKKTILEILDIFSQKLKNIKSTISIDRIGMDIDVVIAFVEKNKEIINSVKNAEEPALFHTEVQSELINQKEYDRLLKLKESSDFLSEVEKSYCSDSIGVHEINRLLKECDNII